MRLSFILLSLLFLSVWVGITTGFVQTSETRDIIVDCYDRYGSVINDLECTETQYSYFGLPYEYTILLVPLSIVTFVIFMTGIVLMTLGIVLKKRDVNVGVDE